MGRLLFISDIHGCFNSFEALLQELDFQLEDHLYILGDLIDKGPDSRAVIEKIIYLIAEGYHIVSLKGNHEDMFLDGYESIEKEQRWKKGGGQMMLSNYGIDTIHDIPPAVKKIIQDMPLYLEVEDVILVHAGFNFDAGTPFQDKHALLWIRDWYEKIDKDWLGDRVVVHGHTPQALSSIQSRLHHLDSLPVLNIDGGCFMGNKNPDFGHLVAVDWTNKKLISVKNCEAVSMAI